MPVATSSVRRMPSAMRPCESMAATDPLRAPTITAPSAGALVRRVREAVGIEPEALARRAGVDVEHLARAEAGEQPLDAALLDTLLLVLGHARATSEGELAASPRRMGATAPQPLEATISAPTRGQLVRELRTQLGVARTALGLRAGLTAASVEAIEHDREALTDGVLETLLLVMGHQPVPGSQPSAAPRAVGPYDAGHLADELAAPIGERLERAMGWNRFAAQIAGAALERPAT